MTNEEILQKAIEKAVKNGYKGKLPWCQECGEDWYKLIYSHDFAKALWGEEWVDRDFGNTYKEYKQQVKKGMKYGMNYEWHDNDLRWGFHLKHMVLSEEPLKYIEKYL